MTVQFDRKYWTFNDWADYWRYTIGVNVIQMILSIETIIQSGLYGKTSL